MTTTATDTATYRKTKTGEWVAYGPADLISNAYNTGQPVTVTRRDGATKQEHIARCGRTFQVDGRDMIYGYLVPATRPSTRRPARGGICDECGKPSRNLRACSDASGLGGDCCPTCASQPSYMRSFM